MKTITGDGYMADGQGRCEKLALTLGFNMRVTGSVAEGLSLRLSEAGKGSGKCREAGIFLTKSQWQELIRVLQEDLAAADEAARVTGA
jgi:hypothetical protein